MVIIVASADKVLHTGRLSAKSGRISDLTATPLPDVQGPNGSSPMAVSPDGSRLYVAFRGMPHEVLSFAIDRAGQRLGFLGRAALPDSMAHLSTDATGRWLFSASYGGGKVAVNAIGEDGVAGDTTQVIDVGPKAHCSMPSRGNDMLYVVSLGTDTILRFGFDAATGLLEPLPAAATTPAGTGPRHLAFDRSGRFAYVVNELSGTVDAYATDAGGGLSRLQSVDITAEGFAGTPQAADIHLTPDGRFLYASERGSGTLAGFAVDASTGILAPVGKIAVPAAPRGFAIAPDGAHLVVLGDASAKAAVHAIDPATGRLTQTDEVPTGQGPNWVELLPIAD